MSEKHFTDSIFYQIELTAKYCHLLGQQVFEKYNAGITVDEFAILDTLSCGDRLCQRDLAKLILKDRANTGKLLDGLEKKGFIIRKLENKNNRPVKIAILTDLGLKKLQDATKKIKPHIEVVKKEINNSDLKRVGELLKEFRNILDKSLQLQI